MKRMLMAAAMLAGLVGMLLAYGPALRGSAAAPAEIKKETLGQTQSAVAPGRTLLLARRTFAPGADSGAHPAPGPTVLFVESGAVEFSVVQGGALVTRSGSTAEELLAAGAKTTLKAGDAVTYDEGVIHEVIDSGTGPAVTLESRLNPTAAATPAATPTP